MTHWYVYIIENKLKQYYTGITKDVQRRFKEHQESGPKCAKALKGKGPLTLKFYSKALTHSEALKTEIWIKKLNKAEKIKLVNNQLSDSTIKNIKLLEPSPKPCNKVSNV